jgi:hypothetical protein
MNINRRLLLTTCVIVLAGSLIPQLAIAADPITELRSVSVFRDADLGKLGGGTVLAARGPAMSFSRGISIESAFVVRAPVKTTLGLLQRFDPSRHSELKTYLSGDVSGRGAGDFQNLASAPSNSRVRAFVDATQKLPGGASKLQLSNAEAKGYTGGTSSGGSIPGSVVAFWSQVLAQRAKAFLSGGVAAQPPYQTGGSNTSAADELQRLLSESGNVRSAFAPIISSSAVGGGRGSQPQAVSWQLFDADGLAAVSLNAFYTKSVGDGSQTADLGYYSSGGYYAAVTFHQLWPVQLNGTEATLVWRVDLVSASALGELRGTERLGSGAAMMREIQKNVKAFLSETPGGR